MERFEELNKKTLLPNVRGRSRGGSVRKLESELDGQLNAARAAATDEGVADANIARRSNNSGARSSGIPYFPSVQYLEAVDPRIGEEGWQVRIGKVGVIEEIEEISAELHADALGNRCGFVDPEIQLLEGRTPYGIPPH